MTAKSIANSAMASSYALVPGEYYWISNDEFEYMPARYVGTPGSTNGGAQRMCDFVSYENEKSFKAPSSRIKGRIPAPGEVHLAPRNIKSDLVQNDDVSEPSVLWALRQRYKQDHIYSSIGSILIVINPYKMIRALYTKENMAAYILQGEGAHSMKLLSATTSAAREVHIQPHIWSIAATAYRLMRQAQVADTTHATLSRGNISGGRQAIIISGESGAGKTEATKMCLQYLSAVAQMAYMSTRAATTATNLPNGNTLDSFSSLPIEDKVLRTNPLLESFGNAKTARNNNSSRFGKWLEINFVKHRSDPNNKDAAVGGMEHAARFNSAGSDMAEVILTGANITEYLLEKSRVVTQASQERNYHIFYQLCAHPSMGLGPADEYQFLNESGPEHLHIEGVDDAEDFDSTKKSLNDLGFSTVSQASLFDALKAIIFLGNVSFEETTGGTECHVCRGESTSFLTNASQLLGIQMYQLQVGLTSRTLTVRGETMNMALNAVQAIQTRNAFAKEMYGRLFSHIVRQVNSALQPASASKSPDDTIIRRPSDLCIGILDIFGFEIFERNTFEQLCINYANEKLQQYFIAYVLKKEQEVYVSEELNIMQVVPRDNEDVLRLIEGKPLGLLPRLDEEVKLSGNDASYLRKIDRDHNSVDTKSKDKDADEARRFHRTIKTKVGHFEIRHFAGVVLYDSDGFVEKNKDKLYDHLEKLIDDFQNEPLKAMLQEYRKQLAAAGAAQKPGQRRASTSSSGSSADSAPTLSSRFQSQLYELMSIITSSSPHFVRCIKPNNNKKPDLLKAPIVLQQLRYSGVLEAIQIRKSGFPVRRKHDDFWRSYWSLAVTTINKDDADISDLETVSSERKPINARSRWWRRLSDRDKCRVVLKGLDLRAKDEYLRLEAEERARGTSELSDIAKVNINNKWTLSVYDESQMMAGRTLVFFKPEALTALENEKIRRGMAAIVFCQSFKRRRDAFQRFGVLSAARLQLQELLQRGYEKSSSNIDVLVELKEFTRHSETDLKMVCFILKECKSLITRLMRVADCIFRIRMILALYHPAKYKGYSHYVKHETVANCTTEAGKYEARALAAATKLENDLVAASFSKKREENLQFNRDLVEDFAQMLALLAQATDGRSEEVTAADRKRRNSVSAKISNTNRRNSASVDSISSNVVSPRRGSDIRVSGLTNAALVQSTPDLTEGLAIDAEEVVDLQKKRAELEDRASVLLILRRAIADRDEDAIKYAVRQVGILNVKYQNAGEEQFKKGEQPAELSSADGFSGSLVVKGSFCEREEKEAQAILRRLNAERLMLAEVSSLLMEFHESYTERLHNQILVKQTALGEEGARDLAKLAEEDSGASSDDSGSISNEYSNAADSKLADEAQCEDHKHHDVHHHTSGGSIYHGWAVDEISIENSDGADFDPHAHASFSHSDEEWAWFTTACMSLNERIQALLSGYTTNPEVAAASQTINVSASAKLRGAAEQQETLLVLAPLAVKIFTAFSHIQQLNILWFRKRWPELCEAVNIFWLMLDEMRGIIDVASRAPSAEDRGLSFNTSLLTDAPNETSAAVASDLLERVKAAEAIMEEHISCMRKELDRYYILPVIQECLLVGNGRKVLHMKQAILMAAIERGRSRSTQEGRSDFVLIPVDTSPSEDDVSLALWNAISALHEKCGNWATGKSKVVLGRARVLALARLCVHYERWNDLLCLSEDVETTKNRIERHKSYSSRLAGEGLTFKDTVYFGNLKAFNCDSEELEDHEKNSFVIPWAELLLTSSFHAMKSLKRLEHLHTAVLEAEAKGTPNKSRNMYLSSQSTPAEPDAYISTAQTIESELWDLRLIGNHEYALALLSDSLRVGEMATHKTNAKAVRTSPIDLAYEEITTVCKLTAGSHTSGIAYLDQRVQQVINSHFLQNLKPLRSYVQEGKWTNVLEDFFYPFKVTLAGSKVSDQTEIYQWAVTSADNFIGTSFYDCLIKLRKEYSNILEASFNTFFIAEIRRSIMSPTGRISSRWGVGTVGTREVSSEHITKMLTEISNDTEFFDGKYRKDVSIVSEELRFLLNLASNLVSARHSMKLKDDPHLSNELQLVVQQQRAALEPFQDTYKVVSLEHNDVVKTAHPMAYLIPECIRREAQKMVTEWKYLCCHNSANIVLGNAKNANYITPLLPTQADVSQWDQKHFAFYPDYVQNEIKGLFGSQASDNSEQKEKPVPLNALLNFFKEDGSTFSFGNLSCHHILDALKKCEDLDVLLEKLEWEHKRRQAINQNRKRSGDAEDSDDCEEEKGHSTPFTSSRSSIYAASPQARELLGQIDEDALVHVSQDPRFVLPHSLQKIIRALFALKLVREAFVRGQWFEVKLSVDQAVADQSPKDPKSELVGAEDVHHASEVGAASKVDSLGSSQRLLEVAPNSVAALCPEICDELTMALDHVESYLLIRACEGALVPMNSLFPVFPAEQALSERLEKMKSSYKDSIVKLDQCIHLCGHIGCSTQRSKQLFEAVQFMRGMRDMQLNNWEKEHIRSKLIEAELAGLGTPGSATEIVRGDLRSAKLELVNFAFVTKLQAHLEQERLTATYCRIIALAKTLKGGSEDGDGGEEVQTLDAVVDEVLALPQAARCNTLTLLIPLLQTASKARKLARLVGVESSGSARSEKIHMELEEYLPKYAEALRAFEEQYSTYFGSISSPHLFGVHERMHVVTQRVAISITSDLDLIAVHFVVDALHRDLRDAMSCGGMRRELVGCLGLSADGNGNPNLDYFDIKRITSVIEQRDKFVADCRGADTLETSLSLPEGLLKLFDVAFQLVEVRRSMRSGTDSDWQRIAESLLPHLRNVFIDAEKRSDPAGDHRIPEAVKEEVEAIELECLHRWVCINLTHALKIGAPYEPNPTPVPSARGVTYALSAASLPNSRFQHLEDCLETVRQRLVQIASTKEIDTKVKLSTIMPSALAASLVYTAELLLPLRRMLRDGPASIIWELIQEGCDYILLQPVYSQKMVTAPFIASQGQDKTAAGSSMKSSASVKFSDLDISPLHPPPPPKRTSVSTPGQPPPPPQSSRRASVASAPHPAPPAPPRRASVAMTPPPAPPAPPRRTSVAATPSSAPPGLPRRESIQSTPLPASSTVNAAPNLAFATVVHPSVLTEVIFISRLASDFIICSHLARALHIDSSVSADGSLIHPYGTPGSFNLAALAQQELKKALDYSQNLDTIHGPNGREPLPRAYYLSPIHVELAMLATKVLSVREAVLAKYESKNILTAFHTSLESDKLGIYEIYRVLENGESAPNETPQKLSSASKRTSANAASGRPAASKCTYSQALELKGKMDELTSANLEAHRKVQMLVEDVERVAGLTGPHASALIRAEMQIVRADCHITDVQNSLNDSCIRAVRYYELKSQLSLRKVAAAARQAYARKAAALAASTRDRSPSLGRERTVSFGRASISAARSVGNDDIKYTASPSAIPVEPYSPGFEDEDVDEVYSAEVILEDVNCVLHALSSGPQEAQPTPGKDSSATRLIQLAAFLLKARELVLIKEDIDSAMQIIAGLQQAHSQAPGTSKEKPLLELILRAPYVRMEYQWIYRHATNCYVMRILKRGLVYIIRPKELGTRIAADSDDEDIRGNVSNEAGSVDVDLFSALPNPVSVYMHGSPLLQSARSAGLTQAIEGAESYIAKALSSNSATGSTELPVDIFGDKLLTADINNSQDQDASARGGRRLNNLITKMNSSDSGGPQGRGSRSNSELYVSTETLLAFCKTILNMRRALVSRDSDAILSTSKQWLYTVDVTKRDGSAASGSARGFSTSAFLKPLNGTKGGASLGVATNMEKWEQLPTNYLQELKNIFVCHQNDLMVKELLSSLKDSGIREGGTGTTLTRKEWELRHDAHVLRLTTLERLLLQFDRMHENSRSRRKSFSYQIAKESQFETSSDGLIIDCASDRSEDMVLSSTLGKNEGKVFIWEPLTEVVAVSRLVYALRRWSLNVDTTYSTWAVNVDQIIPAQLASTREGEGDDSALNAPTQISLFSTAKIKASNPSLTLAPHLDDDKEDQLIAMGTDVIRGLEDRAPPPGTIPPETKRVFGHGTGGGPNAPIAPYPLIQKELELARIVVREITAGRSLRRCLFSFRNPLVSTSNTRSYCLESFQLPPEAGYTTGNERVIFADIDSATIDVQPCDEAESYVLEGLQIVLNTSLGSSVTPQGSSNYSQSPKRYDKQGKLVESAAPVAKTAAKDAPRGLSVGNSSNNYCTRLFNTVRLVRRLREALRTKDQQTTYGIDDWASMHSALRDEGLLDADNVPYFEIARSVLMDERGYILNRANTNKGDKYKDSRNAGGAAEASPAPPNAPTADIRAKYLLHEPLDTELRVLIKQIGARIPVMTVSRLLKQREAWCFVPSEMQNKQAANKRSEGALRRSIASFPVVGDEERPEFDEVQWGSQFLRKLDAAIRELEDAKTLFMYRKVAIADGATMSDVLFPDLNKAALVASPAIVEGKKKSATTSQSSAQKKVPTTVKRKVSSKVDTGKVKPRSKEATPLELLLQNEKEKHFKARRSKPAGETSLTAASIKAQTFVVLTEARGPSERNVVSLLRSARLVLKVRKLIVGEDEGMNLTSTSELRPKVSQSLKSTVKANENHEQATHFIHKALGINVDNTNVASIIASRDIDGLMGIKQAGIDAIASAIVHPLTVPELRYYYGALNGEHRQLQAITNSLFVFYGDVLTLCNSSAAAITSFTAKAKQLAAFSGSRNVRISDMDCILWLLASRYSGGTEFLPREVLSRVSVTAENPAWPGIQDEILELRRMLRTISRTYGPEWYNNTLPRLPAMEVDAKHTDLGVCLAVLSSQDLIGQYEKCVSMLSAMKFVASNGSCYDRSTYRCTGDADALRDAFDVPSVEAALRGAVRFRLQGITTNRPERNKAKGFEQIDEECLVSSVRHYQRLVYFQEVIARIQTQLGIPLNGDTTDKDATFNYQDLNRALTLYPALASELIAEAESLGGGFWEHPLVLTAASGMRARTNRPSSLRLTVSQAVANASASDLAAITVPLRCRVSKTQEYPLRAFRYLRPDASLLPPKTTAIISLTALPSLLASLSVWMNENCIDRLCCIGSWESQSRGENTCQRALQLLSACGRTCPTMRDELLLSVMVRYDSSESSTQLTVWHTLACMLGEFPPSQVFEPYLQCWLQESIQSTDSATIQDFGNICMYRMHESIFTYGYDVIIPENAIDLVDAIIDEASASIDSIHANYVAQEREWRKVNDATAHEQKSAQNEENNVAQEQREVAQTHDAILYEQRDVLTYEQQGQERKSDGEQEKATDREKEKVAGGKSSSRIMQYARQLDGPRRWNK